MSDVLSQKRSISQLWCLPLDVIDSKLNSLKSVIDDIDVSDEQLLQYLSISDLNIHQALNMHFAGHTPSPKPQRNNDQLNISVSPDIQILNRNKNNHNKTQSVNLNTSDLEILNHIDSASNTNNRKRKHNDLQMDSDIDIVQQSPKRRKICHHNQDPQIELTVANSASHNIPFASNTDNVQNEEHIGNDPETHHIEAEALLSANNSNSFPMIPGNNPALDPQNSNSIKPSQPPPKHQAMIAEMDVEIDSDKEEAIEAFDAQHSNSIKPSERASNIIINNAESSPKQREIVSETDVNMDFEKRNINILNEQEIIEVFDAQHSNSMKPSKIASNIIINCAESSPKQREIETETDVEMYSEKQNVNRLKDDVIEDEGIDGEEREDAVMVNGNDDDEATVSEDIEDDDDEATVAEIESEEEIEIKEICITGFDKDKSVKYQQYGHVLGVLITNKWNINSTNIVISTCDLRDLTPSNPSFKVFASILSGIPVVQQSFLEDCYSERKVLDYTKYIMNYRRVKKKDLFHGMNVWLRDTTLEKKKLKLLLNIGNANVVECIQDINEDWMTIMIVARNIENEEVQRLSKEYNCRIISEKWIMHSIYSHCATSFDVFSTKKVEYNYKDNPITESALLRDFEFV